jgi:medium-chain acyl-[acyl-carrier-protein] hydrolase
LNKIANNPWFAYAKPRPTAQLRLFCLPFAGGSAAIFRNWADLLPGFVEVCPIQFPGRGTRLHEQPFTSLQALVDAIESSISANLDKPFAFFGHSMGATISFELIHKLRSERALEPAHFFVSGRLAPQIPEPGPITFNLPRLEFIQELRRLEGTPREILDNQELLELLLPLLRADFELIQTYEYVARPRLKCPITALGGIADRDVSHEQLEAWREQSSGPFRICLFPGNHFFLQMEERLVLQTIVEQLRGILSV